MKSKQFKLISAGIGAGAVIAMGALGAVFTGASGDMQTVVQGPDMTLGETTTSTTAPLEPETPVAEPEVTAEPAPGA